MYEVIKEFYDLTDGKPVKGGEIYYKYSVGETYPRKGKKASKARIEELSGTENKLGTPLIKETEE